MQNNAPEQFHFKGGVGEEPQKNDMSRSSWSQWILIDNWVLLWKREGTFFIGETPEKTKGFVMKQF